jgi:hypothetical protein
MNPRALPLGLALALLLAVPALAQDGGPGPGGFGGFGRTLPGIAITGTTSVLEVAAGGTGTAAFHVAYSGNATLDVQFMAREVGGFGGRGRNFTGMPRSGTFTGVPPGGARNGTRMGRMRRGLGNVTATADPNQATLNPGDEGDVTLTVSVLPAAAPGSDHRMLFLVRSGNGTAARMFTVHVTDAAAVAAGGSAHTSPAAGLAEGVLVLGAAGLARRRR